MRSNPPAWFALTFSDVTNSPKVNINLSDPEPKAPLFKVYPVPEVRSATGNADALTGGTSVSTLFGFAGCDSLLGSTSVDRMAGCSGNGFFIFPEGTGSAFTSQTNQTTGISIFKLFTASTSTAGNRALVVFDGDPGAAVSANAVLLQLPGTTSALDWTTLASQGKVSVIG